VYVKRSSSVATAGPKARTTKRRRADAATPEPASARSRTRLDVDERRAQLVALGLAEFGARTYDEVSIDLLAQMAGISKGLLYHYFPTKRAFYAACVREAARRLLARLAELPADATPHERLERGLDAYLDYVRAHGRAYANVMRNSVGIDPEIAAVVDQTRKTLLDDLTGDMAVLFPNADDPSSNLLRLALHGWIGFAEAMSIAWVEACVAAEESPIAESSPERPRAAPAASEVRTLLAKMLVAVVEQFVPR
jgi:AcrR family transcriptional regulator